MDAAKRAHTRLGFFGVVRYDFFLKDAEGGAGVVAQRGEHGPRLVRLLPLRAGRAAVPGAGRRPARRSPFAEAAERRATTRTFESVLIAEHQRR